MTDIDHQSSARASGHFGAPPRCYWHQGYADREVTVNPAACTRADIVIVGGGFAGLATACRIAELRPETKIVLLEAKTVGYGASGRNGGLVSPLAAPIWLAGALRNARQSDALRLLYRKSHEAAQWAKLHAPDAEIHESSLQIAAQGPLTAAGLSEVAGVIAKSGIPIDLGDTRRRMNNLSLTCHTIQPYKLAVGLAAYARRLGIHILENASVQSIQPSNQGANVTLVTGETIKADRVVVSTNAYSGTISMGARTPGKVVRNFMLATAPLSEQQKASLRGSDSFIVELNSKYIFYRMHAGRLIFGGIDKIGSSNSPDDFEIPHKVLFTLRRELATRVDGGSDLPIDYSWGGRFHMTATDLPIIMPSPHNPAIIYNIGYGGTGVALTLALAPIAAALALEQKVRDEDTEFIFQVMRETRLPILSGIKLAGLVSKRLMSQAMFKNIA